MPEQLELSSTAQAVVILTVAYSGREWAPATQRLYELQLADIEAPTLKRVVLDWIRAHPAGKGDLDGRPEVAELRRAVARLNAAEAGTPYLTTDDAWSRVVAAVERVKRGQVWWDDPDPNFRKPTKPRTQRFVFHCPRLTLAVQQIGMRTLSKHAEKGGSFTINRFRKCYEDLCETDLDDAAARAGCTPLPDSSKQRPKHGEIHQPDTRPWIDD